MNKRELAQLRDRYLQTKNLADFAAWLAAKQEDGRLTRDEKLWIDEHGAAYGLRL
jgi:hypothetical protein